MPDAEIKLVVVTMFEPPAGPPGELSLFRERLHLQPWDYPGSLPGQAWRNDDGIAALVAGVGSVSTALSLLSFGLLSGADLRHAYWLVCGIAGGNPSACSLGSPVWADWVIDGDVAFDFHPADCPPAWSTGILPIGASEPYGPPAPDAALFGDPQQVLRLDPGLTSWAFSLTRNLPLLAPAGLDEARAPYAAYGPGGQSPSVGRGDVLSSARFWHGARHHAWAEQWVRHWTRGQGRFATSSMEDTGTLAALAQLGRLGRADPRRALVLRSVSNYTVPPPGRPAHLNLLGDPSAHAGTHYPGMEAALENGWRAAHAVIRDILGSWPQVRANPPGI